MSTAPAGLTKNLRLQGKFLLFFGLVSLVFVTIFHFVSYLGSRNIVENVVYDRIENDLRAIKVLLNTSLNASVSNILVYEAEVLQAGLNETENLQEYFWTMEATQKRLKARGIDLIALEDLGQRTFPFTPRFSSLWLERDYEGNFYIQEVITRSEGVNDTRIQTLSHREIVNGQHRIHIHTFFYVPALDKVILLSALRSDFVHSLALEDIREAVVGFQFGERGSIELFTKENIQLIHSARQFESTIRDTDLHDKVIRMRSGITREEIPLSDLNSKVYVSSSAADSLQSETIPIYYSFDWIPDVDWFIVHGAAESEILRPVNNLMVVRLSVAVLFFLTLFILTFLSTDTIFIKRLTQLGEAVRRFQERDFEARAEVSENDELTELSQSFNSMAAEIQVYAKDLESLVQHRTEELVQAEKMAALGGLVAGVAHEINTPLGIGVTTSSHILERVEAALQAFQAQQFTKEDFLNFMKEMKEIANILQTSMNQASKLIGSFKSIAVDQTNDEIREFDLVAYLGEIVLGLRPNLKKMCSIVEIQGLEAVTLKCFPGLFYQLFSNLILNSISHGFTDPNKENRIDIHLGLEKQSLKIRYSDNGKGIPKEDKKRVFDPFFTTKRGQGGSGLGLHIIYTIVTGQFGGKIQLLTEGEGAIFEIWLPLKALRSY